ncbi:hypothetical protein [Methyloversatilis discipulorum]|uniref:hypothetical protein n=1 Tax=Methyloversatilis discipulorum TaxID=1119528 RepID=UPI001A4AE7B9|nr:hypothetical protein [Methyloversatilis discipulorum]MBL8466403.1 hypothetical protein [Methyloversatilis discipulorum]
MRFLLLLPAVLTLAAQADDRLSFAVWGDMPYSRVERELAVDLLAAQSRQPLAFSLHIGDLKSGNQPCDDALYADRQALLAGSRHPVVLLPGDNDWLDCTRASAGGHDPFERLEALRQRFFTAPAAFPLQRQAAAPENTRWISHGVLFVMVNLPGSPLPDNAAAQALRREVLDWLDESAAQANPQTVRATVIAFHAHPGFAAHARGGTSVRHAWFLDRLVTWAKHDRRPLLLIHGDTHTHRVDKPLVDPATGERFEHVTRLESHGSPWLGWTRVDVDSAAPAPFRFQPYRLPRD